MKRIFLTLVVVSGALLLAALALGFAIGDPHSVSPATQKSMSYHLLVSVAALIFAVLVHSVLLTYFMGTGRWMEEVGLAYNLDARWSDDNRKLKYRTVPWMVLCLVLLLLNIPFGALSVDSMNWTLPGLGAISPSRVHLVVAVLTIVVNLAVNVIEYRAIRQNGELIVEVIGEVRRIRLERGLPV